MRVRGMLAMVCVAAVLAVGVAGCGGHEDSAATGPGETSTTSGTTIPFDTLPPLTLIPRTTTTADPATTTTTAAKAPVTTKKPLATTTTKPKQPLNPVTTAKAAPPTEPQIVVTFCDYLGSINLSIANTDWVTGFNALHQAVNNAVKIAPREVLQALLDFKAALDVAQEAVDAGTMKSSEDLNAWLLQQTADTQVRLQAAVTSMKTYGNQHCNHK